MDLANFVPFLHISELCYRVFIDICRIPDNVLGSRSRVGYWPFYSHIYGLCDSCNFEDPQRYGLLYSEYHQSPLLCKSDDIPQKHYL